MSELLKELASIGKGYYYYIKDVESVEGLVLNGVMNTLTEVILESSESSVEIKMKKDNITEVLLALIGTIVGYLSISFKFI